MFQKLRIKLTLINTAVTLTLFLLLIAGTYCFSQINIARHTDTLARKIISDIQSGLISDLPEHGGPPPGFPDKRPLGPPPAPPPGPNFFFVKTSPAGSITFQSSGQPLSSGALAALAEQVLQANLEKGTVTFEQTEYSYFKTPLNSQPGTLILFHDLTQEKNMLRVLLTALTVVGIVCSLLSFGASFFLANRAMIPIQRAWQQQKDFLSDISHELRTPLSVIQTNLDIVMGSPEETVSSQRRWLDNIQEESICMMQLVDSLLFLARADSRQQPLAKQSFSFNAVLMRAVAPFEAVAAAKGTSLEVTATSAIEGYGDETRLKQVISILLDNAVRHTPTGGKITVSLSQSGNKTLLTVADTGEGIDAEHLEKIFNRFYQVDKSRNKGGSGLGLAIAKWIIESHGGIISVTSTPGAGTTFTVQMPNHERTAS
ncbi:Sensor histidine kinase RcsC [Sporomusa carbonis]|uniref:sensor histidine kinase n=1 Tax=Sporomusa carbonis TaxID=3076075 RepID=UPI003A621291